MHNYTRLQTLVNNVPYIIMTLLGAAIIALGFDMSTRALIGAGAYAAYGAVGALWIMVFVCPYCAFYGTRACPCGYGTIADKLVRKGEVNCFSEKFKRHIPVIVPLWLIPVGAAAVVLVSESFSWWLLGMVIAFALDAFVILPLMSTKHGCRECPQREDCPWMGGKDQATES